MFQINKHFLKLILFKLQINMAVCKNYGSSSIITLILKDVIFYIVTVICNLKIIFNLKKMLVTVVI